MYDENNVVNIKTKDQFLRMQAAGLCGNFLPAFDDAWAALSSAPSEYYTIRSHQRDCPFFSPVVARGNLSIEILDLKKKAESAWGRNWDPRFYIQPIPHPESVRILNGEVARVSGVLFLKHGAMPTGVGDATP